MIINVFKEILELLGCNEYYIIILRYFKKLIGNLYYLPFRPMTFN